MLTISLIAQKGGTGKTTLALSLSVAGSIAGLRTFIADLDPQASACEWADRRQADAPIVMDAQYARLAGTLKKAEQGGVNLSIIDTPARSSEAALAAAKLSDLIIVPCRPQFFDIRTIQSTAEIIKLAGNKPAIAILNMVPTQWSETTASETSRLARTINEVRAQGIEILPFYIRQRAIFGDSIALGSTPLEQEPDGKAAQEILDSYNAIIQILNKQENLHGIELGAGSVAV